MSLQAVMCAIIACELWGLTEYGFRGVKRTLIFYTQLSNVTALVSAVLLLVTGGGAFVTGLRYLAVCMLVMTFLVTVCVLVPAVKDIHMLLLSRTGFFLHVVCPFLNTASYILLENHVSAGWIGVPPFVTLTYGLIMIRLNIKRVVDGPYPFFRVYHQSRTATVLWVAVLFAVIITIAAGIYASAR